MALLSVEPCEHVAVYNDSQRAATSAFKKKEDKKLSKEHLRKNSNYRESARSTIKIILEMFIAEPLYL